MDVEDIFDMIFDIKYNELIRYVLTLVYRSKQLWQELDLLMKKQ